MNTEDIVYKSIEKAIVEHRLAPGTRLQELKLSKIYNVKRGLVRKVLSRLSHAKLVQQKANSGAHVAKPSLKEAQDLFATRRILENAVIQHLCLNINTDQIQFLHDYTQKEQHAYQQGQFEQAKRLSANFHRELALMTDNNVLIEYLVDIIKRTPLVMLSHSQLSPNKACVNNDHKKIIDAIESRDEQTACSLMHRHIEHLSDSFKQQKELPSNDITLVLKDE